MELGAQLTVCLAASAATFAIQFFGFLAAYALQTETFYDILGGVNYIVLVVLSALSSPAWISDPRKVYFSAVFVCSRSWLLLFLAWRAHERKGDSRFDGVKDKFGRFLTFWMVQGMWVMLISMPMLFVNSSAVQKPGFTWFDWLTLASFAVGVLVEVVADVEKSLWVKAGRAGGFCRVGLWQLSRHPNYFGEILQWWSAWAFAYSSSTTGIADPLWWACIVSPAFTMHILLNINETGIANAEGKNLKRYYDNHREEYTAYRANTSILVPMIGYRYVPMFLKRTMLFEFEKYEYRPRQKTGQAANGKDE
eukprot:TRINITY_DN22267_c0_g2_i1.p1 TRINITY_DN22267_c0_g2~~TRINITY_DN22267_c0_g2_i1.p1  ORF type:complete len:308 (+),score=50.08 TRINITY_DN22267_c0_g2_i1:47-970(+)